MFEKPTYILEEKWLTTSKFRWYCNSTDLPWLIQHWEYLKSKVSRFSNSRFRIRQMGIEEDN